MFRRHSSFPLTDVIDPSSHQDMQSFLEASSHNLERLQRQVEDLRNSLEAMSPGGHPPSAEEGSSLQQLRPSPGHAPLARGQFPEQAQGSAMHRNLPRRITVSLNDHVHQLLIERSVAEGRSISNLAAFIIEAYFEQVPHHH